jgi:hypothetical protein
LIDPRIDFAQPKVPEATYFVCGYLPSSGKPLQRLWVHVSENLGGLLIIQ